MTPDEHAHLQMLEGLVKRLRSRIVQLKAERATLVALLREHGIEGSIGRADQARQGES